MKQMITGALLLSATLLAAQETKTTGNTPVTVRVKKVEKVNGVEKITDTSYTVDGPVKLEELSALTEQLNISTQTEHGTQAGKPKKIVIVTDEVQGGDLKTVTLDKEVKEQVEQALKAAGKDLESIEKLMTVDLNQESDAKSSSEKKITKILVLKTVKIEEPSAADAKLVSKEAGMSDGKLALDNMKFYPNPSNGKFNLDFTLPGKGTTAVTILNVEGKAVYSEELKDFSGHYKKEIDISENPKGVYFVRVKQGEHAQLKKIVLE